MLYSEALSDLTRLSVPEKIIFLETLWDSIVLESAEAVSIPEEHVTELNHRLARHKKDNGALLSLEALQQKIESRK